MNPGLLASGYGPPPMPFGLLGRPAAAAMPFGMSAYDPDARAYIAAVERADAQPLESAVAEAFNQFVAGCKADGIFGAIQASCILMGARTLAGALTPLVGSAPTNNGPFVSGDYNRRGLVGNGTTKYLDTGRNNNADSQNNNHNAVYVQAFNGNNFNVIGAADPFNETGANSFGLTAAGVFFARNRSSAAFTALVAPAAGFLGVSRAASTGYTYRFSGATATHTQASQTPSNRNVIVYSRTTAAQSPSRIAFYSVGGAIDLALLDARVSALYTAINNAV